MCGNMFWPVKCAEDCKNKICLNYLRTELKIIRYVNLMSKKTEK